MRGREEATLSQQHTSPGQEAEEEVEGLKASSVQDSSQVWEAETGGKKWWVNSCPGATKVRPFPWDTRLILQTLSTIPYLLEYFLLPHIIPTIGGRKVQKKFLFSKSNICSGVSPPGFEIVILLPAFGSRSIMQSVLTTGKRFKLGWAGG